MIPEIIFLLIGILIGCFLSWCMRKKKQVGKLKIGVDHADENEPPYIFLELSKPSQLENNQYVVLKVETEDYHLPQK